MISVKDLMVRGSSGIIVVEGVADPVIVCLADDNDDDAVPAAEVVATRTTDVLETKTVSDSGEETGGSASQTDGNKLIIYMSVYGLLA